MKTVEQIISDIQTFKEDNPHLVITQNDIQNMIEERMEELIKEIEEEL